MDTQQLIEQLRRAANALEAIAAGETPALQPGDVAQIRAGHGEHAGRLVIVTRQVGEGLRAAIVEPRHGGAWGTELQMLTSQLEYVGTPPAAHSAKRLTNSERRNASLQAVRSPTRAISAPAQPARPRRKAAGRQQSPTEPAPLGFAGSGR